MIMIRKLLEERAPEFLLKLAYGELPWKGIYAEGKRPPRRNLTTLKMVAGTPEIDAHIN
jgi:hypothetical protein